MRKKASTIVVNVLLILIAISSVMLIGLVIKKMTESSIFLSPEESCLDFQLSSEISLNNVCYNETQQEIIIALKRKAENQNINSLEFIINTPAETFKWSCERSCNNCEILRLGTKNYYIETEKVGQSLTLGINNCEVETKEI
ncbi:MAG: hypothetical protein ABIE22_02665, partial [archaeon]